jgi:hypothetical protein
MVVGAELETTESENKTENGHFSHNIRTRSNQNVQYN